MNDMMIASLIARPTTVITACLVTQHERLQDAASPIFP